MFVSHQATDAVDDRAALERQRHDEPAAVVRVLADQVHPPGGVPGADLSCFSRSGWFMYVDFVCIDDDDDGDGDDDDDDDDHHHHIVSHGYFPTADRWVRVCLFFSGPATGRVAKAKVGMPISTTIPKRLKGGES